jgi:carboxyl-terminal processing protease
VVGSKQTYGKGTVQNMMDFDRAVSYRLNTYKPLGSIKLTHQKFYRISGETTQLQGVFSDVVMPDAWSEIEVGERELPTALAIDQIPAAKFKKVGLKMDKARNKAADRVKADPGFQLAGRYAMAMKENQQQSKVPLSLDAYTAYQKVQAEKAKEFKQVGRTTDSLQVAPLGGVWPEDEAKRKEMKQWHKNLAADLYLGEAARILADLQ